MTVVASLRAGKLLGPTTKATTELIWTANDREDCSVSYAIYASHDFAPTSHAVSFAWHTPRWGIGISLLTRARLNALVLGKRLAKQHDVKVFSCWFCSSPAPESTEHLLLHCAAWSKLRNTILTHSIQAAKLVLMRSRIPPTDKEVTRILLGGATPQPHRHRLRHWLWHKPDSVEAAQHAVSSTHPDLDTSATISWQLQPHSLCVAAFLQLAIHQRTVLYNANSARWHALAKLPAPVKGSRIKL